MKIKELREKAKLSQKEVYEALGVARSTYSDWESGKSEPKYSDLDKLAKFFNVKKGVLLGDEPDHVKEVVKEVVVFKEKQPKLFHNVSEFNLTGTVDEMEDSIREDLNDVKQSFFQIGYKLSLIKDNDLHLKQGYSDIIEYAEDKFGIGKSTTYNLLNVYENFRDWRPNKNSILPEFNKYSYSQLVAIGNSKWGILGLSDYVSEKDTVSDINRFVKVWNKCYQRTGSRPEGDSLKDVLERYEDKPKQLVSAPADTNLGEEIDAEIIEVETTSTPKHYFKNDKDREEFIRSANYVEVLRSEELELTVERLDFTNGACVYRTTYKEYITWNKEFVKRVRYHLIDKRDNKKPQNTTCSDYSLKAYTLDGTCMGYIVDYMRMYKDEI